MTIVLLSRPSSDELLVGADCRFIVSQKDDGWLIDDEAKKIFRLGAPDGETVVALLGSFTVASHLQELTEGNIVGPLSA